MSLMGTLAKVAIGYAAARGVDKIAGDGGIGAMLSGDAGNMQDMMGKLMGGAGGGAGGLQDMLGGLMGQAQDAGQAGAQNMQDMMSSMMGQTPGQADPSTDGPGGLLSQLGGGGAGLAGIMAAMGGMAAAGGGAAMGGLMDQLSKSGAVPKEQEEAAHVMLRAVIQATKADGEIDETEQQKILDMIDGADPEDIQLVRDIAAAPMDIEGLAADTPDAMKPQVYAMSLMSIRVDTPGEKAYLMALADAMGLSAEQVNMLHAQMGAPALHG